ncbi:MAG: ATP-dependent DNA helicase, partial [Lachnospiraceae bacterium]|nr:ATP-dependent DNA helicase [Lachnospiraceae bacterium]
DDPASITSDVGIPDCFQDDLPDIPSIHDTSGQPGTSTLGGISEQPGTSTLGGISEQPELQIIPDLSNLSELTVIDEIKGIYKDPLHLIEPIPVHLAQAKCYAYIYALQNNLPAIGVQMTYAHLETEVTRRFYDLYTYEQLEVWFTDLMDQYEKFAELQIRFDEELKSTVQSLTFPFEYRPGQKRLAAAVYRTIEDQKELFIQAPTGIGKTMSVIYPSLKAMGIGHAEKLFYLTAKTITRTVAEETFDILRSQGLKARTVTITAKEKICPLDSCTCNPAECPMAAGHFDRVNDALYDMLTSVEAMSRENILAYAENHQVCPFEFHLDLSLWAQAIICDYNYVFDPSVYLRRFFGENGGGPAGQYIFLVDEAHNLPDRARSMYSARIIKEEILSAEKILKQIAVGKVSDSKDASAAAGRAARHLRKLNKVLLAMKKDIAAGKPLDAFNSLSQDLQDLQDSQGQAGALRTIKTIAAADGYHASYEQAAMPGAIPDNGQTISGCPPYRKREGNVLVFDSIDSVYNICIETQDAISSFLEETKHPADEELLEFYFELRHFNAMYEGTYDNYVIYASQEREYLALNLLCANPAPNLSECTERAVSTIYFSATLLPLAYYRQLLTIREEPYVIYVDSPFDNRKRFLGIAQDVSSRYTQRGPGMYRKVLDYILTSVSSRTGNYMVFFPSYQYMMEVVELLYKKYDHRDTALGTAKALPQDSLNGTAIVFTEAHELLNQSRQEEEQVIMTNDTDSSMPFRLLIQEQGMNERQREEFLQAFTGYESNKRMDKSLVGFCVIGGIFAEGIDLTGEKLIGSIVVGTGLPQISTEGNLLRAYFDEQGKDGYDYAYKYPGINKVFQAAGRVIRTVDDQGIVLLLDNRLLQRNHVELFPMDWENYRALSIGSVRRAVDDFWQDR